MSAHTAMNPMTLLTVVSLAAVFALWARLESSALAQRRAERRHAEAAGRTHGH